MVTVDGRPVRLDVEPGTNLQRALWAAGITGPKAACEEGECGSCTVRLDGAPVCSCLVPAAICDGSTVETAASLLAPDLADALLRHGGVQCGFCTPGFVVAAESFMDGIVSEPDRDEVREALAGNLCRCTGYEGIVGAVLEVARSRRR